MDFNEWHVPGRGSARNKSQVRISKNYISISRYCVKNYFGDYRSARIGYDSLNNRLIIKPTIEDDKLGFKLIGRDESNFLYINAKYFVMEHNIAPQVGKKSEIYECEWDAEREWIEVKNIKGVQ